MCQAASPEDYLTRPTVVLQYAIKAYGILQVISVLDTCLNRLTVLFHLVVLQIP